MVDETRQDRRRAERDAHKKDLVAEQGLASTLRKMQAGGYTLMFPPAIPLDDRQVGEAVEPAPPPFKIAIGRVVQGLGFIHYGTEYTAAALKDDKELAYALALTLHGYGIYEAEALRLAGLSKDETGKNGNGAGGGSKIILTDG